MWTLKCFFPILRHAKRVGFNIPSLMQFIYYNFLSKQVKGKLSAGALLFPYRNCIISVDKTASIILEGPLILGIPSMRGSKKHSYLSMKENSKLIVHKSCRLVDGADIQIHKNATWEMDDFHSNTGLEISCGLEIRMQGEVTGGRHVRLKDYNGHYVSYSGYPISASILIENHVWLCTGSTINPGVHICTGSVIGDNANVVSDVPTKTFCLGNPAQVIETNIEFKI